MQTRLTFHNRIVSTVFEQKDESKKCFELIHNAWKRDQVSVCEASGLLHWLQDRSFSIYLNLFYQLMSYVDILYG